MDNFRFYALTSVYTDAHQYSYTVRKYEINNDDPEYLRENGTLD